MSSIPAQAKDSQGTDAMANCPVCDFESQDSQARCPEHGPAAEARAHEPDAKPELPDGRNLLGATIRGQYQVKEIIGKGAMGVVYKAFQLKDNKAVAIKVLHTHLTADPESIKRFQYEAKAASSLLHANIVRIYDVGVGEGGQPYIVMELLDGLTLSQFLKERHHLNTNDALPLIRQTCEALAEAHSRGVLHRDIKPANIMLCNRFGMENFVLVLDFSIAKIIQKVSDVDSTTPGLIFGSPTYMSPERFMGKGGDFRSDIYSMGIIIFQLLAGRAPFKNADLYTLMNEHIATPPPRVRDMCPESDVPELLEQTIARALAKRPEDRQENMKQLLHEINEVYKDIRDREPREPLVVADSIFSMPGSTNALHPSAGRFEPGGLRTPDNSFATFSNSAASKDKAPGYGFEIDPAAGSATNVPNQTAAAPAFTNVRKPPTVEESGRPKTSEYSTSGRWDRNISNRISTGGNAVITNESLQAAPQRQRIRPAEPRERMPIEIIALAFMLLLFLWIMWPRLLPTKKASTQAQSQTN
jgi:serine/threonine protein kinase